MVEASRSELYYFKQHSNNLPFRINSLLQNLHCPSCLLCKFCYRMFFFLFYLITPISNFIRFSFVGYNFMVVPRPLPRPLLPPPPLPTLCFGLFPAPTKRQNLQLGGVTYRRYKREKCLRILNRLDKSSDKTVQNIAG